MNHSNGISYERRLVLSLPLLLAGSRRLQANSFSELTRTCNSLAADLLDKEALTADQYFDALGAPPLDSRETFRVRETENRVLRPGRSTSITPVRDNIHTFEAGSSVALGFDLNTFLPGEGDWSMLELTTSR